MQLLKSLNSSNCDCTQVVLTLEYTDAWRTRLSELPHVSVVSYDTSGVGELELRQQIRSSQRAMGLSGLRDIFGLPQHSEPLLQDAELHREIQVRTNLAKPALAWHWESVLQPQSKQMCWFQPLFCFGKMQASLQQVQENQQVFWHL